MKKRYEITFQAIQSYFVEADSEKEAEEQAWLELNDDVKHNLNTLFEIQSILEQKEE
jgi:hypothetical protein